MKKIYLIRHAQSESNAQLFVRPNPDINITELGKQQADELATWLTTHITEPIDGVFVSSYVRTHQTARPYLAMSAHTPVVLDDLREFNYLDFEHIKDLAYADIVRLADEFWAVGDIHHTDSPTTDSYANLVARVKNIRSYFESLTDGTYVAFGHGMWLGMLMWQLLHADDKRSLDMQKFRTYEPTIRPKNCEVYLLQITDNASTICKVRSRGGEWE